MSHYLPHVAPYTEISLNDVPAQIRVQAPDQRPMTESERLFVTASINGFAGIVNNSMDRAMSYRKTFHGPNGEVVDAQFINGQMKAFVFLRPTEKEEEKAQPLTHMYYASEGYKWGIRGYQGKAASTAATKNWKKDPEKIRIEHLKRRGIDLEEKEEMYPGTRDWYSTTVPRLKGAVLSWWTGSRHRYGMIVHPLEERDYVAYGTARREAWFGYFLFLNGELLLEIPHDERISAAALFVDEDKNVYVRIIARPESADSRSFYVKYYETKISRRRLFMKGRPLKVTDDNVVWKRTTFGSSSGSIKATRIFWDYGHINSSGTKMILLADWEPAVFELDLNRRTPMLSGILVNNGVYRASDYSNRSNEMTYTGPPDVISLGIYNGAHVAERTVTRSETSTYSAYEKKVFVIAADYKGDAPQIITVEYEESRFLVTVAAVQETCIHEYDGYKEERPIIDEAGVSSWGYASIAIYTSNYLQRGEYHQTQHSEGSKITTIYLNDQEIYRREDSLSNYNETDALMLGDHRNFVDYYDNRSALSEYNVFNGTYHEFHNKVEFSGSEYTSGNVDIGMSSRPHVFGDLRVGMYFLCLLSYRNEFPEVTISAEYSTNKHGHNSTKNPPSQELIPYEFPWGSDSPYRAGVNFGNFPNVDAPPSYNYVKTIEFIGKIPGYPDISKEINTIHERSLSKEELFKECKVHDLMWNFIYTNSGWNIFYVDLPIESAQALGFRLTNYWAIPWDLSPALLWTLALPPGTFTDETDFEYSAGAALPFPLYHIVPHCCTSSYDGKYAFYSYLIAEDAPIPEAEMNWLSPSAYTGVSKIVKLIREPNDQEYDIDLLALAPEELEEPPIIVSGLVFAGPILT